MVLTGPLCAGKSTLARGLASYGFSLVTAVGAIEAHVGRTLLSRVELQEVGAALERSRPGEWLVVAAASLPAPVVLDAVRTAAQAEAARRILHRTVFVHLTASRTVRRERFEQRARLSDSGVEFDAIARGSMEQQAEALSAFAGLNIDTEQVPPADVLATVLRHLSIGP